MVHLFCLSVHLITLLPRLMDDTGCGIMLVSHTQNQALLTTLVTLNSGLHPLFNITQCPKLGLVWGMDTDLFLRAYLSWFREHGVHCIFFCIPGALLDPAISAVPVCSAVFHAYIRSLVFQAGTAENVSLS